MDIAEFVLDNFGNDKTKIEIIGLRPKEKIHELLVSRHEVAQTMEKDEYYVVLPEGTKPFKPVEIQEYSSFLAVTKPGLDFI
jgi:FlaA1/EpsC-like NDP-sugar epimerase